MKMKNLFLLPALIASVGLILAGRVKAQTLTTLHAFTALSGPISGPFTNSDGAAPIAGLILSGNTLYGTAQWYGPSAAGTVFKVNTDGTGFTPLHIFTAAPNSINSDGAGPTDLVLSGNTLYGTASSGGSSGWGTVFAVNTDGTDFTILYSFTAGSDGQGPYAGLILSFNTLYGTTRGGSSGAGTVFKINTDGTGFTALHNFTALIPYYTNSFGYVISTNSDGAGPGGELILSGNTLYGTATGGGSSGSGTLFAVNTDGTGFTTLHSFAATDFILAAFGFLATNSDGAFPLGELILSGNTLYGTAADGGSSGNGTVFSLSFAPQLTITPSGAYVILTWPTNVAGFDYTGYTLQSTTNLVSPAVWTAVSPGPVVIDGQNAVTNLISGTQQFYRLSQ